MRLSRLIVTVLITLAIVNACAALFAQGSPPTIESFALKSFFSPVAPGDPVEVTVKATRPGGIKELWVFFERSRYVRADGREEQMISFKLKPTGKPDEFRADITVPKMRSDKPELPVPEGPYRLIIYGGLDDSGNGYYHSYGYADSLAFDPKDKRPWLAKVELPGTARSTKLRYTIALASRRKASSVLAYTATITDKFGSQVTKPVEGSVTVAPGGKAVRKTLESALPGKADEYRVKVVFREKSTGRTQEEYRRLPADIVAEPRRELRLDGMVWEYAPDKGDKMVGDTISPTNPSPANVVWQQGRRMWAGRSLDSIFGEGTQAVWVRAKFQLTKEMAGKRCELRFGEVRFGCKAYLNGTYLGEHIGPFFPFQFDVSRVVKPGQVNTLLVRIMDERVGKTKATGRFADRTLWPIPAAMYDGVGIPQEVSLRAYPAAYLDDVFAQPSFQRKELLVRTSISNASASSGKIALQQQVEEPNGTVVLRLPTKTVTLAGNKPIETTLSAKWANPKLWAPGSPYLYRLRSTITGPDGKVIDEVSTRFGFREFWVDGRNLMFNGQVFRGRVYPQHRYFTTYEESAEHWRELSARLEGFLPSIYRHHCIPPFPIMMDAADEAGVMVENEGPLGSVVSDLENPSTWKNYRQMWTAFAKRDRNHASLVMWSAENEILICTNTYPDLYGANQKNLLAIGRHIESLDPTRPIEFNGDADVDGTWSTMNFHYPRWWYQHPDMPNSAFWLEYGKSNLQTDTSYPLRITWNTPKPVILGEDGLLAAATQPHDLTSYGGDLPYRLHYDGGTWGTQPVDDKAHAMLTEGYRNAGVAMTSVAYGGTGGPECDKALLAVRSFVRERDSRFWSGEAATRTIYLHHDAMQPGAVAFTCGLVNGGKGIDAGKTSYQMKPGQMKRLEVKLNMPVVTKLTPVQFVTTVIRNGKTVFTETHNYVVYPRQFRAATGLKLGVLDRKGATADALSKLGLSFLRFGTLEPGTDTALKDMNCLIVGEDGLDPARMSEFAKSVKPYLEQGGTLIVLRQNNGEMFSRGWLPTKCLLPDADRVTTMSFRRSPNHPILKGVTEDMLRWWRGDNVVSARDFLKSPGGGWQPIIDSGGPGGLRWCSVAEVQAGAGRIVLCQMNIVSKLAMEPAAGMLLENMLSYAATRKPQPGCTLACITDKNSAVASRLTALGFSAASEPADVTLVDASSSASGETVAAVRGKLTDGGTVILHGLTPENNGRWASILPAGMILKQVDLKHAVKQNDDRLLEGISGTDLWWGDNRPWDYVEEGGTQVAYAVEGATEGTEIVAPGALTSVPVGKGRLLIDQMLWEKDDVNKSRSGQYISGLLGNVLAQ